MIKQFDIWIADLNPQIGTETGKIRPVVVIQTDLLNRIAHPSTIICPLTTNIREDSEILRILIKGQNAGLNSESDIIVDQIRAIDNNRLIKKVGELPNHLIQQFKENLLIILDLEDN